jgi:hypothetical protein
VKQFTPRPRPPEDGCQPAVVPALVTEPIPHNVRKGQNEGQSYARQQELDLLLDLACRSAPRRIISRKSLTQSACKNV